MKGLLSVSFGTSCADASARAVGAVEGALAQIYADRVLYRAWTSRFIVAKVRAARGGSPDLLDEAFARLNADGVDDLLVSTLCLVRGRAMTAIESSTRAWMRVHEGRTARLAKPLLADEDDQVAIARILSEEFAGIPADDVVLLMGHGSADPSSNEVYAAMQRVLADVGQPRFFLALAEGDPGFETAMAQIEASGASGVHLAPFMMVAGTHALNDLAGDDGNSWKSALQSRGYRVSATLRGLGEYPAVREVVLAHVRDALPVEA